MLSAGLKKRGDFAVASGGFTDIWRGKYYATQVAIKAFRVYLAQNSEEANKVSIKSASEVCSRIKFTDPAGTGADVDEAIPRKHPTASRRQHDALSTCPRL